MAYSNIDQAVTIPVNQDVAHFSQQLYAQSERKRYLQAQQEKADLARQEELGKYVGTQFTDKNYLTGTALDPFINTKLAETRQKYAAMIKDNPGMSFTDLQFQLQKDIGDIGGMASGIKNVRANVEAQVKAFEKYPGIDANSLKQLALNNFLYKVDPKTGQRTLKNINELDPSQDYVSQTIMDHPELVAKGDQGLRSYLKTFQPQSLGETTALENKGITTEHKYQAKVPAYMQLIKGKDGIATGVKVRGEIVPGMKNPDGSPLEVADHDVYQAFTSDPASSIVLQSMFKDWNTKQKTPLDAHSEEADLVKRKLLYDYLGKNGVYEFKPEKKVTNNSLVDKQQLGVPLYRQGLSDAAKLLKADQKLEGLDPALIMRGLGGDQRVLEGAATKDVEGKTYYDLTNTIGGMKIGYDNERKPVYAQSVLVDPVSKNLIVQDVSGASKEYHGKDIRKFIKNVSEYNGITLDKADRVLNLHMDKDGNYIAKQDVAGLAALQAQRDIQNLNKKKEFTAILDKFQTSGDISDLDAVKGTKLKDGSTIETIDTRGGVKQIFGMDPFYIEITDKKGTKKKKTFTSAYDLAEYIKTNAQ